LLAKAVWVAAGADLARAREFVGRAVRLSFDELEEVAHATE
jgi:hypothetical protein